jgi:hypothetical protein
MGVRDRIKKTFSRHNSKSSISTSDPTDRKSSHWYQPGEKIPYKYRRPVDPEHKAALDGFSFGEAFKRRSTTSQYSPMGSRIPSRRGSTICPLRTSMDVARQRQIEEYDLSTNPLATIQSVATTSDTDLSRTATEVSGGSSTFSPEQLAAAMKKVAVGE